MSNQVLEQSRRAMTLVPRFETKQSLLGRPPSLPSLALSLTHTLPLSRSLSLALSLSRFRFWPTTARVIHHATPIGASLEQRTCFAYLDSGTSSQSNLLEGVSTSIKKAVSLSETTVSTCLDIHVPMQSNTLFCPFAK